MTDFVFAPAEIASVPVYGGGLFPVRRIFCIGKNYADHVREMGGDPKSSSPVFFTKPADAVVTGGTVAYPPKTSNLHFEGELVVALSGSGRNLSTHEDAGALIFGAAAGCDLTRRDLQHLAKEKGGPWDTAKGFDQSAPIGPIGRSEDFPLQDFDDAHLITKVNNKICQNAPLSAMLWNVPELICELSRYFELMAGDLIFTGTPEGVGPLKVDDNIRVEIGSLPPLEFQISAPK